MASMFLSIINMAGLTTLLGWIMADPIGLGTIGAYTARSIAMIISGVYLAFRWGRRGFEEDSLVTQCYGRCVSLFSREKTESELGNSRTDGPVSYSAI